MLLQFLVVSETWEEPEEGDSDSGSEDVVVTDIWEFIKDHWKLPVPKLIIYVAAALQLDDDKAISEKYQEVIKSIIEDLVKGGSAHGTISLL